MKHTLHQHIPAWMVKTVTKSSCNECNTNIRKEDILGIGIKEVTSSTVSIFIEYKCKQCSHSARMNFTSKAGSIEDVCHLLLDQIQKRKATKKSQENTSIRHKNVITKDETDNFIKDMNKTEDFNEFLKLIGASNILGENNLDQSCS